MISEQSFHKAQGHNHHGFLIKFYLFDLVAHFRVLEISPSQLLGEDLLNFFQFFPSKTQ